MDDIKKTSELLDKACEKLCKRVRPSGTQDYAMFFRDRLKDDLYLKAELLNQLMERSWGIDAERRQLERKVQSLEKKLEEQQKKTEQVKETAYINDEINRQEKIIKEQEREIKRLQLLLQSYISPPKKDRRKNAYKSGADAVQIYKDIEHGMSRENAAKKYKVSRETIRKRYKEGKQIVESGEQGI